MKTSIAIIGAALMWNLPPRAAGITEVTNAWHSGAPAEAQAAGFAGTVVETMDAGRYTYVLVNTGQEKTWAAAPKFPVKTGDQVNVSPGIPMRNFPSKALNRTFDTVYFVDRITVAGAASAKQKSVQEAREALQGLAKTPPPSALDYRGLSKPAGGCTVAEIYARKTKLANQPVLVRGKVVKYNAKIMKKNWLHIRDGSGAEGANDLAVTTQGTAKVGDTVLVRGILALDKDFGYGYKYEALLENCTVTVETPAK